jgi:hypothetical protein
MLKVNKRLLSLNLSNNMIDSVCGDYLEKAMKKNTTLIDFDISLNPYMTLKQVTLTNSFVKIIVEKKYSKLLDQE